MKEVVREVRRRFRLSQARLAAILGVSPSTIWRWEKGISSPRKKMRRKLEELLDSHNFHNFHR